MANKREKILIIDGNAIIHRSFHALPPTMRTKSGEPTNAVYGFANFLLKAIREFHPEYVALTFDLAAPTFRHEEYKEYKATREKAPDELYAQIPRAREIATALGIPIYEVAGFEADDAIGSIVEAVGDRADKVIVTGDMDTLQLIDDTTGVYTMSRGLTDSVLYDADAVRARYGLDPAQMIDYKALRGDPSDNIPGVRGIGEKTAVELLHEFGTLDGVYEYLGGNKELVISNKGLIRARVGELLADQKEQAYFSRRLATIRRDAPIDFDLEDARFGRVDLDRTVELFSELEFKSLLGRVQSLAANAKTAEAKAESVVDKFERNRRDFKYILVDNDKAFEAFFAKLKKAKAFAVDTETSSFDPLTADLLGISFSWKEGEGYYLQCRMSNVEGRNEDLFNYNKKDKIGVRKNWLERLKPILEDDKIGKYGHNIKFDIRVLRANGIELDGVVFDTMVASYLLNPGSRQHNLDAVTFSEFGFEKITKDDLLGKGKEKVGFAALDSERLMLYSAEDADFSCRLAEKLSREIRDKGFEDLYRKLELPLVGVLSRLEDAGIRVDPVVLKKLNHTISRQILALERKIHKEAGGDFNIGSPLQLQEVLFNRLAIPTEGIGRIKTGISTAADELNKLKDLHPIIPLIQEYRELTKLKNTYIDTLPELVNPKTGRIHTSFNQAVAVTGRLSSTEPNLQNIPIRTELGRSIRCAFVAEPGKRLLSLDYSQIELRLAAHMSADEKMIKAFRDGEDIHTATAAEINSVPLAAVTREMRREAKAINFGLLYGQGPHGLSQTAGIPFARAKEFIELYFKSYPGIREYVETAIASAREKGYAETLYGRRRPLPEIDSAVVPMRRAAERTAINTPLQGTAADMIKDAMVKVDQTYREDRRFRMLLQVHDELVFEVAANAVELVARELRPIMEGVLALQVPVIVDASAGENWGEMTAVKFD